MPIRSVRRGKAHWIIIDREDKGNSLDYEHLERLAEEIKRACSDRETVALVITGKGRFFSTGVDLGSVASIEGDAGKAWKLMWEGLGGVCKALLHCDKPVIAAVNGHAIGIGFELLYAADIAVAVRNALLGSPAVRWGMVPPASTTIAPLLVGYKRAAWIALTGETITAEEAERMGFVNKVVDSEVELEAEVDAIVESIAEADQWAVRQAKKLLLLSRQAVPVEAGLEALAFSAARRETSDAARLFIEKKKRAVKT